MRKVRFSVRVSERQSEEINEAAGLVDTDMDRSKMDRSKFARCSMRVMYNLAKSNEEKYRELMKTALKMEELEKLAGEEREGAMPFGVVIASILVLLLVVVFKLALGF